MTMSSNQIWANEVDTLVRNEYANRQSELRTTINPTGGFDQRFSLELEGSQVQIRICITAPGLRNSDPQGRHYRCDVFVEIPGYQEDNLVIGQESFNRQFITDTWISGIQSATQLASERLQTRI